jgi:hypothetical protein
MPENVRMWVEVSFNICYLLVVWGLVWTMWRRRHGVRSGEQRMASLFLWAFALLALGDTGHVGFRVVAYALGGLEARPVVLGTPLSLVGIGAVSTAYTVTVFYVLMLGIWRLRTGKALRWLGWALLAAAAVRLVIMALPQNEWSRVVPPEPWGIYRNVPLIVQGLGVAYLILRDAGRTGDRTFGWIGIMILISYACYMPVIFFVDTVPLLGMLMIPKTMAYLGVAFIAYNAFYRRNATPAASVPGKPVVAGPLASGR